MREQPEQRSFAHRPYLTNSYHAEDLNVVKPIFQKLWDQFPDHALYPTMKDLYTMLGGAAEKNIHSPGFGPNGNACASRLSVAFNKAGTPIDMALASAAGCATVGAADGTRIIYRVKEFRNYLIKVLGNPTIDNILPYDDAFNRRKGIIAFKVNWGDASGHIALWNGTTYREPVHDNFATYVSPDNPRVKTSLGEFWELT